MTPPLRRTQIAWAVALLLTSKAIQFAIDSQPLLFVDSTSFVMNALGTLVPERSYVYGWVVALLALPFRSFQLLVASQMAAGAATAGILGYILVRYCGVRYSIALTAALLLAWDPTQIVHEHLVMTEAGAALAAALFLLCSLRYLAKPSLPTALFLSALGAALVGFRVVYVPLVWASAAALPLLTLPGHASWKTRVQALAIGASVIIAGQLGYQYLTGRLAHRPPAYHYRSGPFLLAQVSPIVIPEDASDDGARQAIRRQMDHRLPLLRDRSSTNRAFQLWNAEGLISRLHQTYQGDFHAVDQSARLIARNAIRRDPLGFLRLGVTGLAEYPRMLGTNLPPALAIENGSSNLIQPTQNDWQLLTTHFNSPTPENVRQITPSRQFHLYSRPWCWLQFLSPLLGLLACLAARPGCRQSTVWLALWSTAILAVTCLLSPIAMRYLHPLSFTAFAALAVLAEAILQRRSHPA